MNTLLAAIHKANELGEKIVSRREEIEAAAATLKVAAYGVNDYNEYADFLAAHLEAALIADERLGERSEAELREAMYKAIREFQETMP
jgi:hypothetical protein